MNKVSKPTRLGDVLKLFDAMRRLYEQLVGLIQSKIDAMRRADVETMRQLTEQEQSVVTRLHEREGFCRQLLDALGEEIGLPPRAGRALSVSQLASHLPPSEQTGLLHASSRLREVVFKATRANRVAGVVSRELLNHAKWILGSVRPAGATPVGYSGDGALVAPVNTRIFETVG
jgi:hypothetical protein